MSEPETILLAKSANNIMVLLSTIFPVQLWQENQGQLELHANELKLDDQFNIHFTPGLSLNYRSLSLSIDETRFRNARDVLDLIVDFNPKLNSLHLQVGESAQFSRARIDEIFRLTRVPSLEISQDGEIVLSKTIQQIREDYLQDIKTALKNIPSDVYSLVLRFIIDF